MLAVRNGCQTQKVLSVMATYEPSQRRSKQRPRSYRGFRAILKGKVSMNPKHDPLVKATRKAYRESAVGQLEALLKEERRWKSKETMASNKLKAVRAKISICALQLARENDGGQWFSGDILKRAKDTAFEIGGDK